MKNLLLASQNHDVALIDLSIAISDKVLKDLTSKVENIIRAQAPIGIAFSGGVDSSLLLALAVRAAGKNNVKAIIGVSPSLPERELTEAKKLSCALDVELIEVFTNEMEDEQYLKNETNRCFFCKDHLFESIKQSILPNFNLKAIAFGEIATDLLSNDRPGTLAATKHNVLRPLADVGFTKEQVRNLAKILNLPNWNKPSAPCLSSRIPFFTRIDVNKLSKVEIIENFMHDLGFRELRFRNKGIEAILELSKTDLELFYSSKNLREQIYTKIISEGFGSVVLNLKALVR